MSGSNNQVRIMEKFIIKNIVASNLNSESDLIRRLHDLGLHPGLEVEVVARVSFNSVIIIQYGSTRLALNKEEFACLRGH